MTPVPVFHLAETELQEGTTLIEASAGTGKTFTIAGLFLRLILEKNLSVREILVVTYTVAATEELRHRIRQTLAKALQAFAAGTSDDPFLGALVKKHASQRADLAARLDRALYGFDEAPIYTIHGFCQRVLKDRAFETGSLFDTELVTDQMPLLRQVVEDYWRRQFYRAGKVPVIFALKNGLSPDALLPLVRGSLHTLSSSCFHPWTTRTQPRWPRIWRAYSIPCGKSGARRRRPSAATSAAAPSGPTSLTTTTN